MRISFACALFFVTVDGLLADIWDGTWEWWCTINLNTLKDELWGSEVVSMCRNTQYVGSTIRVFYSPSQQLIDAVAKFKSSLYRLGWWQLALCIAMLFVFGPHCKRIAPAPGPNDCNSELDLAVPKRPKRYRPPKICCLREVLLHSLPLSHSLRDLVISYTDAVKCCSQVHGVLISKTAKKRAARLARLAAESGHPEDTGAGLGLLTLTDHDRGHDRKQERELDEKDSGDSDVDGSQIHIDISNTTASHDELRLDFKENDQRPPAGLFTAMHF